MSWAAQLQKERASETLLRARRTLPLEQGMLSSASFCHCFGRFVRQRASRRASERCSCCCFTANFNLCKLFSRPNGCCVWGLALCCCSQDYACLHTRCATTICTCNLARNLVNYFVEAQGAPLISLRLHLDRRKEHFRAALYAQWRFASTHLKFAINFMLPDQVVISKILVKIITG